MINPVFNKIDLDISSIIKDLPKHGILRQASSGLVYLDIDDRYIHDIFPQIKHKNILKPDYFSEPNAIGAHISVIYPEEIHLKNFYLNENLLVHHFRIDGIFYTEINNKEYFALQITCPTLIILRKQLGLSDKLNFKNYLVDLHITVASTRKACSVIHTA